MHDKQNTAAAVCNQLFSLKKKGSNEKSEIENIVVSDARL
jgi:hypothetical protein